MDDGIEKRAVVGACSVLDLRGYLPVALAGVIFLASVSVAALLLGAALPSWNLALFALLGIVVQPTVRFLPRILSPLFVLAVVLNAFGWGFNLFSSGSVYDAFTHAFTSFAIALGIGFLLHSSDRIRFRRPGAFFTLAVTVTGLALGALWEIAEWLFGARQTYSGVVLDLAADFSGSLIAGITAAMLISRLESPKPPKWLFRRQ